MSELLSFGNLFGYSIAGCMGCNGFLSPQDDTWSISVFCVLPASHLQRGRRVRFFVKFRSGVVRVIGRLGCQVGRYHLFRSWFPGSWFSHGRVTVLMPVPCDASPLRCQSPAMPVPCDFASITGAKASLGCRFSGGSELLTEDRLGSRVLVG